MKDLPTSGPGFDVTPCSCVCEDCRALVHKGCPAGCQHAPAPYCDEEMQELSPSPYDGRYTYWTVVRLKATIAQHRAASHTEPDRTNVSLS